MDEALKSRLEDIKKVLNSFGWWIEKAGTTIHTSDVILAVDGIEQWRTEAEELLVQDEDGDVLNDLLIVWIGKARENLKKKPLSDFQAVLDISRIDEPNISIIVAKIDSFIYKNTGDIRTFII